ncbi:MAG: alpha/beta hydrolase [Proteobacteria bacterium]|nr:alpha/beta hydrolase [Pseudomonadota bacterium]
MARVLIALLVLSLAACQPRLRLPGEPVAPPRLTEDAYIAADGARLPLRVWLPEGRPKAVLVALHGFNDYSNAFEAPAAFWAQKGIATYAYDQRGFGATEHRGEWPGIGAMANDLRAVSRLVRARHAGIPFYLVGISMGGAVAMVALTGADPPEAEGVVLAAPAVWGRRHMNVFQRAALWLSAHTVPWLRLTGRGLGIKPSDNTEMLRALGRDPLVIKETRIDTIWGLANLMDAAFDAAPKLTGRALILYGANDEVVPKDPTVEMIRRLPAAARARQRVAMYEEGFHMLLRDLQADAVLADIIAWIEDAARPLPSGADERARERLAVK